MNQINNQATTQPINQSIKPVKSKRKKTTRLCRDTVQNQDDDEV